ncbi:DUF6969 family protein [Undibacterium sp. RuRC25W]|uniref:DUF6969 family protein n=1 Tax=Undibacterium sp. RuRC25W TaxID=3413047 RepID=UPI003BEFF405
MKLPQILKTPHAWSDYTKADLNTALKAAAKLVRSMQTLSERHEQVVQSIIGGDVFVEWDHYPENDVRDDKTAYQYFYHAHPGLQRPFIEHGHFHLFVHAEKMGMRRPNPRYALCPAHLITISMDAQGIPNGFFVVNRWVTKGPWLTKEQCALGLKHFNIQARKGTKEINQFLQALIQLYQPTIFKLLEQRDLIVQKLSEHRDRRSVFADPMIEVVCYVPIQLMDDIASLESAVQDINK